MTYETELIPETFADSSMSFSFLTFFFFKKKKDKALFCIPDYSGAQYIDQVVLQPLGNPSQLCLPTFKVTDMSSHI